MEGILHAYIKKPALNLFEYTPRHPTTSSTLPTTPPNILLFIGGLYDNFSSPPYLIDLAQLFPRHNDQQWALKHVQLSSATLRCHISVTLDLDYAFIRRAPLSVSRFLDLASPSSPENPRQEDFFSHDLHESRLNVTFGQVGARQVFGQAKAAQPSVLILISESDEVVSQPVTAQDLLRRWEKSLASDSAHPIDLHGDSMCIKDATHDISGESPLQQRAKLVYFRGAVLQYIDDVVGGVDKLAFGIHGQDKDKIRQLEEGSAAGMKL